MARKMTEKTGNRTASASTVSTMPVTQKAAPRRPSRRTSASVIALPTAPAEPDLTEEVRTEAYLLWLGEGQPQGRDMEHWLQAESTVRRRHDSSAATMSQAAE